MRKIPNAAGTPSGLQPWMSDGVGGLTRLIIAASLTVAVAGSAEAQSRSDPLSIRYDSIASRRVNATVPLRIALPYEYDSDESSDDRFPVLIFLGANDSRVFNALVTGLRLLEHPLGSPVPPLIVVGVASQPVSPWPRTSARMDSLRPNAGGADDYVAFIREELLPWVRSRFRTHPYTAIAGHSVYGQLAVHVFARAPDAIDAAVAVSPAFWWLSQDVNDDELTEDHARRIALRNSGRLYFAVGEFDPWPIRKAAQRFRTQLRSVRVKGDRASYTELEDDNHQSARHLGFIDGLRWVFRPISLGSNAVYAAMGGYSRDIDSNALTRAYERSKRDYAEGARSLGFPEALPARYLASLVRLPPIERRNDPIPIFRLICDDFRRWYPRRVPPQACGRD